jgi:hypothetical protein
MFDCPQMYYESTGDVTEASQVGDDPEMELRFCYLNYRLIRV